MNNLLKKAHKKSQIRLLQEEQSDLGLYCLLSHAFKFLLDNMVFILKEYMQSCTKTMEYKMNHSHAEMEFPVSKNRFFPGNVQWLVRW